MVRTQIYLSKSQKQALERLSTERGLSIAELIRTAIDCWLQEARSTSFEDTLEKTFGLWRDREDIRNSQSFVRALRKEWQARAER